jgi:hypothetical protein
MFKTWYVFFADDHSRVILKEHPPDDDNGYINASYIDVSLQVRNLSSTEIFSLQCFLRKSSFLCF